MINKERDEALKIISDMFLGLKMEYHGAIKIDEEKHQDRFQRLYELTHPDSNKINIVVNPKKGVSKA